MSTFQGSSLFAYTRLLNKSVRHQTEGMQNWNAAAQSGRPLLWAFWHGQLMAFITFADRYLPISQFTVIVVGDERGDTLTQYGELLGANTVHVDMEGNPFAAGRAVLQVIKAMKRGGQSAVAPDGPDGPPFVAKAGVGFLARKAEAVLLPAGVWTRWSFQLERWDKYLVPLPFANIQVVIGSPIYVSRNEEEVSLREEISTALDKVRARAMTRAGERFWR
jgi:lysophospholipid acyltransferase (LPLAT)-like uncharacterized protein